MILAATVELPPALAWMRRFPMNRALLLFDRESGTNVLCDGPETAHLRQQAPRVVQFGITNDCNLACSFCSRDLAADSAWTSDEAFRVLADLADAGVLEVAFGGGEPWAFPGFAELVRPLHGETPLAPWRGGLLAGLSQRATEAVCPRPATAGRGKGEGPATSLRRRSPLPAAFGRRPLLVARGEVQISRDDHTRIRPTTAAGSSTIPPGALPARSV